MNATEKKDCDAFDVSTLALADILIADFSKVVQGASNTIRHALNKEHTNSASRRLNRAVLLRAVLHASATVYGTFEALMIEHAREEGCAEADMRKILNEDLASVRKTAEAAGVDAVAAFLGS